MFGPQTRAPNRSGFAQAWQDQEPSVWPGESIEARIASLPQAVAALHVVDGVHYLRGPLNITRAGLEITGSKNAIIVLQTANAVINLKAEGIRFTLLSVVSGAAHATHAVHVQADGCMLDGIEIVYAKEGVGHWPVYIDADSASIGGVDITPADTTVLTRSIYLSDTTKGCVVTGNNLYFGTVTGAPARNQVSFKVGTDNECGQAALVAGTHRSYSNFADVEVRP